MVNKSILVIGLLLIAGVSGIIIAWGNSPGNEEKISVGNDEKVSVIHIGSDAGSYLKFILLEQKGWLDEEFAKDGIKVEYHSFAGGAAAQVALASGSLDFAYTGSNPSLRTAAAGADTKLIAIASFGNPVSGSSIIVRNDSTIKSISDLKGKKVGYLKGTGRHSSLAKALSTVGMSSLKDIESFNLDFAASGPALIRGDIDALVEGESTTYPLISTGQVRAIWKGKDHPDLKAAPSTVTVRGDFAKKHPDIVKRFLKFDLKAAQWADINPDDTIKINVNATKQAEKAIRMKYPANITTFYLDPQITNEAIQSLKDEVIFLRENELLDGELNIDSWVLRVS